MAQTLSLYDALLPRALPAFVLPVLKSGQRALVIGMGGGCDVIAAFALAQNWKASAPHGATVMYSTCVSPRPMPVGHEQLASHLWRCPMEVVPLVPGDEAYGSTRIEQSLPRGPEGSPLLFVVPRDGKSGGTVEEITAANSAAIGESLARLRVDTVLAVDFGGDSLTGGIDFTGDPECGRDRQVLHALRASKLPCVQLVLGPGCDGESSVEAMRAAVRAADERGQLLGVLPLADVVGTMAQCAATLKPSRTPNIVQSAFAFYKSQGLAPGTAAGLCTISRHGHEQQVPWAWLTVALAFKVGPEVASEPRSMKLVLAAAVGVVAVAAALYMKSRRL